MCWALSSLCGGKLLVDPDFSATELSCDNNSPKVTKVIVEVNDLLYCLICGCIFHTKLVSASSIKSSQAYNTFRCWLFSGFCPTNTRIQKFMPSALLVMFACLFFLIVLPLCIPHPAPFSTCAGCTPGLQTRLCVFSALATCHATLPGSEPHHPGNLPTVCPSPLQSLFNPAVP